MEVTEFILANLEQTKAFGKKILEFENEIIILQTDNKKLKERI